MGDGYSRHLSHTAKMTVKDHGQISVISNNDDIRLFSS